jgi:Uma2 family endonuclease
MASKTLLTLEQFDQLPVKEGVLYELDGGDVITMTEPMPRHNRVRDRIARIMGNFVEDRALGGVFSETGYQLTPETVRIPDVSFLPVDRMQNIDLDRRIQGAPTLAVEVVSPTDLAEDLTHKVQQYLAAGTKAVWVFYPRTREVQVFRADGSSYVRREHEALDESDLLPGFLLDLKAIFES